MVTPTTTRSRGLKGLVTAPLRVWYKATRGFTTSVRRIRDFSHLASLLRSPLPSSVVMLGPAHVFGTGAVQLGEDCLLYPDVHFETHGSAVIRLGDGVVLSRGVHLVAMEGITVGRGTMIGEYTSVRDANHRRSEGVAIRNAGYSGGPIVLGDEVWIGRGVTILPGVTIGDGATVGANAVVTRDVAARTTVVGVPAKALPNS